MDEKTKKYLSKIGKKGNKSLRAKYPKEQLIAWTKLGGRPKKPKKPVK